MIIKPHAAEKEEDREGGKTDRAVDLLFMQMPPYSPKGLSSHCQSRGLQWYFCFHRER